MPTLETLPGDAPRERVLAALDRDGGVILRDFVQPALLAAFDAELDGLSPGFEPGSRSPDPSHRLGHGDRTRRYCGLAARTKTFPELLLDARLLALADAVLLPACGSYWLNTAQVIEIGPGERPQFPHRDEQAWPEMPWGGPAGPEITLSTIWALSDFTRENGATRFAPGSHRWTDPARLPGEGELARAEMSRGSVLVFSGKAIHGGGANETAGAWRRGLQLSFVLGWLRPEENHYLAAPLDVARTLPKRAQQLLGYAAYRPRVPGGQLGLVDYAEAEFLVRGEPPEPSGWGT